MFPSTKSGIHAPIAPGFGDCSCVFFSTAKENCHADPQKKLFSVHPESAQIPIKPVNADVCCAHRSLIKKYDSILNFSIPNHFYMIQNTFDIPAVAIPGLVGVEPCT